MKLYIPTTSLNFNNILSTESISPKGFYSLRGFGYSRWFTIPENDLEGIILLYESPAEIIRPASDLEDHPLLIEIDTVEEYPIAKEGVRYSKHTIYFNPWNTTFLFQTEKDKMIALSLSDSSLETKLLRLYERKIKVLPSKGNFPSIDDISIDTSIVDTFIEKDKIINNIKGLLYGYYIGVALSTSLKYVEKLNSLREIQNIFASIISSIEKTPSFMQKKRLEFLFHEIAIQNPIYQGLLKIIGDERKTEESIEYLINNGITVLPNDWRKMVNELQYETVDNNLAIKWIKSEINKLQNEIYSHRQLLSTDAEEIITSDGNVLKVSSIKSEDENKLYTSWINDILVKNNYNGKISSINAELSDTLTKSAVNIMGDKWQDSAIRTFLNQLRKHIRGYEFTQAWTNGILSSLAAVLLKGDDWETMLHFMQSKGMTDYRLAFSFYGIINGFAGLPRDFTDILFKQNREYIADVYKEFHGQLHGVTINVKTQISESNAEVNNDSSDSNQSDSDNLLNDILHCFQQIDFKGVKKKKDELLKGLQLCIENNKPITDITLFITALQSYDQYGWKKSTKAWKTMQQHFCPCYNDKSNQKSKKMKKNYQPLPLFNNKETESNEVLSNLWNDIEILIPDSSKAKIREDVEWFVKTMCNPTEKQKYYSNVDINDTKDIIERLIKLKSGRGKDGKQKAPYFPDELRSKVRDYLYKKYGIR